MIKLFIIFSTLFISLSITAQVIKVDCFEQRINGGNIQQPEETSETGLLSKEIPKRYFLFLEIKKKSNVVVTQVWIQGNCYNFKTEQIKKLPFILTTSSGGEMHFADTLIKSAAGTILQINNLVVKTGIPPASGIKKAVLRNAVVVCYRIKKRNSIFSSNKIKTLRPLFTQ